MEIEMKDIINLFDSELRAMSFLQMELLGMLDKKKIFTKNEEKLKVLLKERLHRMIDAGLAMQELVNRLKEMEEFEMLHVIDVDELLDED